MNILDKIIKKKREEIALQLKEHSSEDIIHEARARYRPRGFVTGLLDGEKPSIIAEIKRGSPSRGIFRPDLDPILTAEQFARGQANAISILTDTSFFGGSQAFVPGVRDHLHAAGFEIPLLRKDFIIDPFQVWQSRLLGADAILLILAALNDSSYALLLETALQAELDVLVEIHNTEELNRAIAGLQRTYVKSESSSRVALGINNRNLKTFVIDLSTTETLAAAAIHTMQEADKKLHRIPLVSESGIFTPEDISRLEACAVDAFLVGEALVAEGNPESNIRALRGTQ